MRVVALGGLGEIGRNMNVIEYNRHLLLIDCGVLFPDEEQPGVDVILPDFSYIKDRLDDVEGLVLTHGHEDHIGGVPYLLRLRPDIPLIGSKLTLGFVAAKCEEFDEHPKMITVEDPDSLKVGPFTLDFISVTHSIPDALAVCVKTPAGHIIDTGDMKIDPLPLDRRLTDLRAFAREGEEGVDLLMMDSTNAEVKGFVKPEISVTPAIDLAFSNATRKIIVASFSSHVHRVQQIVDIAHKYGRKVVFVGRSMVRNMGIASDLGYLKLPQDTVIDLKAAKDYPDDKLVYMCTGSQGEPLAALGRIANGVHPDIQINEFDTVILASSLIPGNESEVYKVINKLTALGARVINRDNAPDRRGRGLGSALSDAYLAALHQRPCRNEYAVTVYRNDLRQGLGLAVGAGNGAFSVAEGKSPKKHGFPFLLYSSHSAGSVARPISSSLLFHRIAGRSVAAAFFVGNSSNSSLQFLS